MRNVIAWIGFNRTTDSNKIVVIVLDDQKSRELRRIRTTGLAVYLFCGIRTWMGDQKRIPREVITSFFHSFSKAILKTAELPSLV